MPAESNQRASALRSASSRDPAIRFRDVTEASGITFVHCSGNNPEKLYPTANGSGVAMLDYDGDGRLDLYFATTRNLPLNWPSRSQGNRLYRNRGTARSRTSLTGRASVSGASAMGWPSATSITMDGPTCS